MSGLCVAGSCGCKAAWETLPEAPKISQDFEDPLVLLTDEEMDFESAAKAVYADALALLLKKHSDYGPKNISESPGGALNGLRVRIWDKVARLNNLIDSGVEPANESLRDSFVDLANYSMIALLVIDGKWPA